MIGGGRNFDHVYEPLLAQPFNLYSVNLPVFAQKNGTLLAQVGKALESLRVNI